MKRRLSYSPVAALWALVGSMLLLAGCAPTNFPPAESVSVGPAGSPEYVIGPGDSVQIFVWRNEELSSAVPVRPDGRITTPLVEDLPAAGKTPSQLARDMEEALAKYVKNPVVTVIVTGFQGPYDQQIRVVGQAAEPRALPYRDQMSLLDVMIAVGGITEFAAGNRAVIVRRIEGKPTQLQVRIDDLLNGGDISANVAMMPGDILIIPEAWF